MQQNSTEYYLAGIKSRNETVIKDIYREFLPAVTAFVLKNNGQKDDARDVFNKVIYQFTARLERESIDIKVNFEVYLFSACKNLWRRELLLIQKRRVTNEAIKELYYAEKDMVQATLEQERWELFQQKIVELSGNCNQILQLFFNKMSSHAIMTKLGYSSEVTVRQRIFKCKTKLMKLVKSDSRYKELLKD
jgi:RNA polymerase sigma factor (sigma-70 family)